MQGINDYSCPNFTANSIQLSTTGVGQKTITVSAALVSGNKQNSYGHRHWMLALHMCCISSFNELIAMPVSTVLGPLASWLSMLSKNTRITLQSHKRTSQKPMRTSKTTLKNSNWPILEPPQQPNFLVFQPKFGRYP